MCGRYASARTRVELLEEFDVERDATGEPLQPDYNVAPTKQVYAVLARQAGHDQAGDDQAGQDQAGSGRAERQLRTVRWGLVPSWAKDVKAGAKMINARAETVAARPAFRRAFARRRCLLPADGYYEWQALPGGGKQPVYITRADGGALAFAGVYELWRDPARPHEGSWLWSAAVITTSAPDELGEVHDRMPMIIDRQRWADWLDPALDDPALAGRLLVPAAAGAMATWPVSTQVNSVRNNGPELVEPAGSLAAAPAAASAAAARHRGGQALF